MARVGKIVEKEQTWVSIAAAARYSGVARGTIASACKDGRVPARRDNKQQLVPLEVVLLRLVGKDIERLRARVDKAANMTSAPVAVRDWARAWQAMMFPLLDRLQDAERRAALAEAQLDILKRQGSNH